MPDPHDRNVTTVTVFGILIRHGRVLMVRRAREPYKGLCTLPGGHKMHGESLKNACLREMAEETGLILAKPVFAGLMEVEITGDGRDFLSVYFAFDDYKGEIKSSVEGEIFWAGVEDASVLPDIHPAFRALAPYLLNHKKFFARAMLDKLGEGQYEVADL